jgi:hypothetical protein
MDSRIFHGNITPSDVAQALMAEFNQGNLQTQLLGESDNLTVQIASSRWARSGGTVQVGQQQWLGVAASLGQTAIATLLNPINLLGRLDDIAQDVSNLQLTEKIWQIISAVARTKGAGQELSERLSRLTCEFCGTANPVGEPNCIACGAPLGKAQPTTCKQCGFVLKGEDRFCPNCGAKTNI